jgi:SAM-dependent methyltransferase
MKQDGRIPFFRALQRARASAYGPGEFVEQESFMRASEILALVRRADIAPGVSVLDLCCGVGGPGRFITKELDCAYLGVDYSSSALAIARERARDLPCRFEVSRIPPIPSGPFDVVILFETMLAFPDKETLLRQVSQALTTGGRFTFTMEEGAPLTDAEREMMPDADTVWLTPLQDMLTCLQRVGLVVRWQDDRSRPHRDVADSLINAFATDAANIAGQVGRPAFEELLAAHRLWSDWLREGRVRKLAIVAEKVEATDARLDIPVPRSGGGGERPRNTTSQGETPASTGT